MWGRGTPNRCHQDVHAKRLCGEHFYQWPYQRYVDGAEPTDERVRSDGSIEWNIDGTWGLAHRMIIAREYGRRLRPDEVVVHLDGDRSNNDQANLWVTDRTGSIRYRRENPRREASGKLWNVTVRMTVQFVHPVDDLNDVIAGIQGMLDVTELDGGLAGDVDDNDFTVLVTSVVQTTKVRDRDQT